MEATGHETEAKFSKKAQQQQIRPSFARLGTLQGCGVEQPQLSRRKAGPWSRIEELLISIFRKRT
jgi:hypothetical protein